MSLICDRPDCGQPAKRIAVQVDAWQNRPTFKDTVEEITFSEFAADLCEQHASDVIDFLRSVMTEEAID